MANESDYHGQEYREGEKAQNVPPEPETSRSLAAPRGTGTYAQVTMIGNYGIGCAKPQTTKWTNITLAQARKLRWDHYGVCGAQMTCYDAQGNVVHEE